MDVRNIDDLIRFSDEKMQKLPVFDSPKYFFDLYCLKPGQDQRIHTHAESDKIYFVVRGRGLFHIAGEEKELGTKINSRRAWLDIANFCPGRPAIIR